MPWQGRTLTPQPFAGDTGQADAALTSALGAYATGRGGLAELAGALLPARVFVPIVAVLETGAAGAQDGEASAELLRTVGDAGADMALITLTGKDGTRALPVFSSVAALAGWDPQARPVPVEAARAAQAAVAEGCDVLLLDLGAAASAVLPRPVVWAIGQGRAWLPPSRDPEVLDGVRAACADVPEVRQVTADDDDTTGLHVVLGLEPGLDRAGLEALTAQVQERLRSSRVVAERVDGLRLQIVRAG